jgi:flavin reductase (DIM6/NTAB) family NADH-FMN oxidoreductase RutF
VADERHLSAVGASPGSPSTSPGVLRDVMSHFATGITVLTAGGDHSHGMTANAFTSVSLDPPMVLCCIARTAQMHEAILRTRSFGVNVLSADQEPVARYFASRNRPKGIAQFDQVDWISGPRTGAPLIAGSLAWLECELAQVYHGGDHSIFLGSVLDASRRSGEALLFFGGGFHQGMPPARSA